MYLKVGVYARSSIMPIVTCNPLWYPFLVVLGLLYHHKIVSGNYAHCKILVSNKEWLLNHIYTNCTIPYTSSQ